MQSELPYIRYTVRVATAHDLEDIYAMSNKNTPMDALATMLSHGRSFVGIDRSQDNKVIGAIICHPTYDLLNISPTWYFIRDIVISQLHPHIDKLLIGTLSYNLECQPGFKGITVNMDSLSTRLPSTTWESRGFDISIGTYHATSVKSI